MAEKEINIGGLSTEKQNGGQSTPVIENTSPREQLKVGSKFASDEDAPKTTNIDGDLVVGKNLEVDGNMKINGEEILGDLKVDGNLTVGSSEHNADLDVYGDITATGNESVGGNLNVGDSLYVDKIYEKTENAKISIKNDVILGSSSNRKSIFISGNEVIEGNIYGVGFNSNSVVMINNGKFGQAISQNDFLENLNANVTLSEFSAYKIGQFIYLHAKCTTSNYSADTKIFDVKTGYRTRYFKFAYTPSSQNWNNVYYFDTNGRVANSASATGAASTFTIDSVYEIA